MASGKVDFLTLVRSVMNTLNVRFDPYSKKFMAWLGESIDGESPICQVNSWEQLNFIADSNKVQRSAIRFEPGTIEECDKAWGDPT